MTLLPLAKILLWTRFSTMIATINTTRQFVCECVCGVERCAWSWKQGKEKACVDFQLENVYVRRMRPLKRARVGVEYMDRL